MVVCKLQSFFDIQTASGNITEMAVYIGGDKAQRRMLDYFGRYKYFKPGRVTVTIRPCATLPVDPAGLSIEAGEQTVDPRDIFGLGMCRITNGERFPYVSDLTQLTDADKKMDFYNNMLMDPRWFKFSPHRGVTKSAKPMLWNVVTAMQNNHVGSDLLVPVVNSGDYGVNSEQLGIKESHIEVNSAGELVGTNDFIKRIRDPVDTGVVIYPEEDAVYNRINSQALHQSGRIPIQWMPCDDFVVSIAKNTAGQEVWTTQSTIATIPYLEMMRILLPPAIKTKMYFRVWITETYFFKGFTPVCPSGVSDLFGNQYYGSLDRMVRPAESIRQVRADTDVLYQNRHVSRGW